VKTVVGLFDTYAQAQKAVQDLEAAGIARNNISFVTNNANEQYTRTDTTTPAPAAEETGAETARGAVAGGITGLIIGLAPFVIPGLGAIAAMGWLTMTLVGAGVGAAVGLVGALTGAGVPEEDAAYYNEGVRRGGTLIAVKTDDAMADRVAQILSDDGAINIDERAAQWRQEGFLPTPATQTAQTTHTAPPPTPANTQARAAEGEAVFPVVEEKLQVGKRQIERGGVRVYSHIEETPVTENVTLREEHVTVDRRPVDRPITDADMAAFKEDSIEVTEMAEEPVVAKQARVVEEVVVGKEATQRTETIKDTVRRTDVEVEQIPGSEHVSRTAPTFDTYASDFRNNWQTTYAKQGGRYEDYEPAYQYGYALINNPTYRGQNWSAIESNVQQDWNRRYPNTWDRFKNSIRYAWDRATGSGYGVPGEGNVPGIQTGGRAVDGTPDTRGITEKVADTVTGDRIDDKTGKPVA